LLHTAQARTEVGSFVPGLLRLRRETERLEFTCGTGPRAAAYWAVCRREPEQTRGFFFRALLQRKFSDEEIGIANLASLDVGIGIVDRGGEYGAGRHWPRNKRIAGAGPLGHIELRGRLRELAPQIAALIQNIDP
jgi:hypothetical protein